MQNAELEELCIKSDPNRQPADNIFQLVSAAVRVHVRVVAEGAFFIASGTTRVARRTSWHRAIQVGMPSWSRYLDFEWAPLTGVPSALSGLSSLAYVIGPCTTKHWQRLPAFISQSIWSGIGHDCFQHCMMVLLIDH
jgi:hypothetical protein